MKRTLKLITTIALIVFLSACGKPTGSESTDSPTIEPTLFAEPTATEELFALSVNGEKISIEEFTAEIERVRASDEANGITRTDEERRNYAVDEFVGTLLLAQDAYANGFSYSDADHQTRLDALVSELGSEDAFNSWLTNNGYTRESFRIGLERAVAAAFTRDRLIDPVLKSGKQYHVQELLLYDRPTAEYYYNQFLGGADFNTLAATIDPITRGDIGWFPIGYLPDPIIETAVTSMEIGAVSEIIEGDVGFYILKLLEVDEDRELSPDALIHAQKAAVNDWVTQKRAESEIIIK